MQIQEIGNHERFVVVDDDGRYWSGPVPGWVEELRRAKVFAKREKAEKVIRILGQQVKDIQDGNKYVAQVIVTTSSDQRVPLDELRETLERRVGIMNELEGDLLVINVAIDWDTLRGQDDA